MEQPSWHIIGDEDVARHLRGSVDYVQPREETTLITDAATIPEGAIATGRAVLVENAGQIVPHFLGFRVVDEVRRAVHAGEMGQIYGCYGSYRGPRDTDSEHIATDGLLPLLAVTLEIIQDDVTRVWSHRASLLAENDAWFVTLTIGEVIVTLEALATTDPPRTTELLIEVTGSERVLRAEPTRQAITVAPFDAPAQSLGWWEDAGERFLQLVNALEERPMTGSANRLQSVWNAIQESAGSGSPVTLG